jgi:DNA-nicking Smr family endonuclease
LNSAENHDTEESINKEGVKIPIDGILDLHTFCPKEIPSLLDEYIRTSQDAGIYQLRIIHGKGTGTLRTLVHSILSKHPLVMSYALATESSGSWGATLCVIRKQ